MFEFEQDGHRHTRAIAHTHHHHCHQLNTAEPTATLDAAEWEAIGAFLDSLSPEVYANHSGSLYAAYKLQTSIVEFLDALVSAGYYSRK